MEALVEAAAKVQVQVVDKARAALESAAERMRGRSAKVQARVSVADRPATAILEMAASGAVDLVAMETHGRKGLARLFLGSVADKVLRGCLVPLLHHPASAETGRKDNTDVSQP
jgi:nucleotide-binding universal stress UspA family protein